VVTVVATVVGLATATLALPGPASAAATKWNLRILPIARDVERLRGVRFEHAVPVDFLSDTAFQAKVSLDAKKLSGGDKQDLERAQAQLRAVGLLRPGVDLLSAVSSLRQSGALAFYDSDTKRVTVRGEALTPAVRVTLAHELTHALQDQHFDLKKLQRRAARANASAALTALVEGDAVRVQQLYANELPSREREQYEASRAAGANGALADARSSGVPDSLIVLFQSPYLLGPVMLQLVQSAEGAGAIDGLFRRPPVTDSAYLDPTTLVEHVQPTPVATPALQQDERAEGKAEAFGAFVLYLILASRTDPVDALTVADGWAGDSMVTFTRGTSTCLRATFAGRTPDAAAAIGDALRQWAAAAPDQTADATVAGSLTTLTACDPGPGTASVPDRSLAALTVVDVRNTVLATLAQQGVSTAAAGCTANGIVADPAFRPVLDAAVADPNATPSADLLQPLQQRILTIAAQCALRR
jgi:hypothetical protein